MSTRAALALLGTAALLWACGHRPSAPAAPAVRIPAGCEVDLSGEYALEGRVDWRYAGVDDGGTLLLHVTRAVDDGGAAPEPAADAGVTIVLMRGPDGFHGATHGTAWPTPSAACPVEFPTRVQRCEPDRLVLQTVTEVAVDESCRPAPAVDPVQGEVHLVRARALPPPDGGS